MSMDLERFVAATLKAIKAGAEPSAAQPQRVKVEFDLAVAQDEQNPAQIEVDQAAGQPTPIKLKFDVVIEVP